MGEDRDRHVEAELEHREEHHEEIQRRRGHLDLGRERGRDHAHHDESAHVNHGVTDDAGVLDHYLRGVVHAPEDRGPEHRRREEGAAVDRVHDQEPQGHGGRPETARDEPFAQDPRQLHALSRSTLRQYIPQDSAC